MAEVLVRLRLEVPEAGRQVGALARACDDGPVPVVNLQVGRRRAGRRRAGRRRGRRISSRAGRLEKGAARDKAQRKRRRRPLARRSVLAVGVSADWHAVQPGATPRCGRTERRLVAVAAHEALASVVDVPASPLVDKPALHAARPPPESVVGNGHAIGQRYPVLIVREPRRRPARKRRAVLSTPLHVCRGNVELR